MSTKPVISRPRATRGKTVGRAVVKSFIHDYAHGRDADFKPLYTQRRFNEMVEGIQSDHEYGIYLQYVALHNGLSEELVRSQAYAQQAQHGLAHMQTALMEIHRAAEQDAILGGIPALDAECAAALRGLFMRLDTMSDTDQETIRTYSGQLLVPSLRGLMAYNALIALLADALAFPELLALAAPLDDIERDIAQYNADLDITCGMVDEALLLSLLPRVDLAAHQPAPEAIAAAREQAAGLQSGIVQQLFIRLLESTP